MISEKRTVGLVEKVKVTGKKTVETYAVFDTGAKVSSIDVQMAGKIGVGEAVRYMKVKNPSTKFPAKRPVVKVVLEILGQKFDADVNIQDRSHMSFPVIVGRNVMSGNFVVDCQRNEELFLNKGTRKDAKNIKDYV